MKKFALTILAAMGLLLCSTANSQAGVHVGFYLGGPGPAYCPPPVYYGGYYPYGYYNYGYRDYGYHNYGYYHPYYHHRYYHHSYGRRW